MQETWVGSLGWEDPLGEGMATHSSIPVWRVPMDRGARWATVHGVTKSDRTEGQSTSWPMLWSFSSGMLLTIHVSSLEYCLFKSFVVVVELPSHIWLFAMPWTLDCQGPVSMEISRQENTGVDSRSILWGIFPTQGSNPGLPHCRWILYCPSHRGSPWNHRVIYKSRLLLMTILTARREDIIIHHCKQSIQRSVGTSLYIPHPLHSIPTFCCLHPIGNYSTQKLSISNEAVILIALKIHHGNFPGGPVAKTPHSQCSGPRFNPWSGN